jgi:hypothetical protein
MQSRWRRTCSDIFEFSRFHLHRADAVVMQFLRSSNTLSKSQIRQTGVFKHGQPTETARASGPSRQCRPDLI